MAWREFRRGKRHKSDVMAFEFNLESNLFKLHEELLAVTYEPDQYNSFFVCDPKRRHIHKASMRDRVLHQAVFRVLYTVFDTSFIFDSYSCRKFKGTHAGVRRLEIFARRLSSNYQQPIWALKCDVRQFFASIKHELLLQLIGKKVHDPQTLQLITKIIDSFHVAAGVGLPLGNVTSQLFANIYLHEFDWFVKHSLRQKFYLRYCDDFIILGRSREELSALISPISLFLENSLGLQLHPQKITLRKLRQGIDFLGYVVRPYHKLLRTKTKRRIVKRLERQGLSVAQLQAYNGITKFARVRDLALKLAKTT